MRTLILVLMSLMAAAIVFSGCGGNATTPVTDVQPVIAGAREQPVATDLAGLDSLPAPNHVVSVVGPDWYELELFSSLASAGVVNPHPIDELPLAAISGTAYAIYGVYGFDGDSGPTSARVTGANYSGEYYVGFSDYVDGNWAFSGPFTGGTTVEIPMDENHLSPNAYTNENGHCYVSVVVTAGGSLTLTNLELGLHGGTQGPRAPTITSANANSDGVQIGWIPSRDCLDPDFAGYVIERETVFHGEYIRLNTHPTMETIYIDNTAVAGNVYKYKVWAVDTAGNGNASMSINYGINPSDLMNPVAVLDIPKGPLYGPVSLTFDLSGSYDPEGDPIDTYAVSIFGTPINYTGADPAPVLDLQPGNYKILVAAESGPRTGYAYHYLKVYPTWNTPVVANASVAAYPRGLWLSAGVLPATGRVAAGTADLTSQQFVVSTENEYGALEHFRQWVGENAHCPQPPVVMGEELVYLVQSSGQLRAVSFDGNELNGLFSLAPYDQNVASLTGDGVNQLYSVVCVDVGGSYDLMVITTGSGVPAYKPAVNVGDINWIHALYNPGVNAIDIVFNLAGTGEMYWVRDDFSGVPVLPIEIVAGANCSTPIMAINPGNNRPMVAFLDMADSAVKFTALQSDLATWTAPETIDNSLPNLTLHNLVFSDGYPIASIGLNDGTYNVYRRGAGWLKTNTLVDSNPILSLATLTDTSAPNSVTVVYHDTAFNMNCYNCDFDGTNTLDWSRPGIAPTGIELHAAAGSDGLHVVYVSPPADTTHLISPDGISWAPASSMGATVNLDLVATAAGEVYVSYYNTPSVWLDYWDGASWNNVSSIPTTVDYRQIMGFSNSTARIEFACYNTTLMQMTYQSCLQGTPNAITNIDHGQPVWGGVVNNNGTQGFIAKGAAADNSVMNLGTWGTDDERPFFYGGTTMMFLNDYFTKGKTMAFCTYSPMISMGNSYSYLFTSNMTGEALRVDREGILPESIEYIDALELYGIAGQRRTVTAMNTDLSTGVVLYSEVDADNHYFAWSNFGEWETLPLPYGVENMMSAELLCDMDGRWHLLYRDWVTDDLMCVSTR